ncbi:MAG: flagellar assembly protein FliW [Deltaproteobacteria bacterium]|nr:flagellar assembly protein FliW [Deltaproteobacteria bacterium]
MKVKTLRFGEVEVPDGMVFCLTGGLIGFPLLKRFVILEHKPGSQFRWLQSVDDPDFAFVVIDPLLLAPDYPLDRLRDAVADGHQGSSEVVVAAITTVPPEPEPITVNLMAPVAFNAVSRVGAQIVLHDGHYSARHVLARTGSASSPTT